jgi:hypothetical protein
MIYGGVAWPGKRPGFALVVGMDRKRHFDSHDIYLLDEYESFDIRKLVRQCVALDRKYFISYTGYSRTDSPGRWIGQSKNDAAYRLLQEVNDEFSRDSRDDIDDLTYYFSIDPTPLYEMENLYPYILAEIKELLDPERRQLFLKESKVANYLSGINPEEVVDMQLGDYPAVEALGIVVAEMRSDDIAAQQSMRLRCRNSSLYPNWKRFRRR